MVENVTLNAPARWREAVPSGMTRRSSSRPPRAHSGRHNFYVSWDANANEKLPRLVELGFCICTFWHARTSTAPRSNSACGNQESRAAHYLAYLGAAHGDEQSLAVGSDE